MSHLVRNPVDRLSCIAAHKIGMFAGMEMAEHWNNAQNIGEGQ